MERKNHTNKKALSQQSIRSKRKLNFPKRKPKQQTHLRNLLEIYEDQRPIKTVKRSPEFPCNNLQPSR
jgi:hypothetical protein